MCYTRLYFHFIVKVLYKINDRHFLRRSLNEFIKDSYVYIRLEISNTIRYQMYFMERL